MLLVWPLYSLVATGLHRLGLFPARRDARREGERIVSFDWIGPRAYVKASERAASAALVDLAVAVAGDGAVDCLELVNPETGLALDSARLEPIRSDFTAALARQLEGGSIEGGTLRVNRATEIDLLSADLRSRMSGHLACELPIELDDAVFAAIAARHGFAVSSGGERAS